MKNTLTLLFLIQSFFLFAQSEKLNITYSTEFKVPEGTDLSSLISNAEDFADSPEIKQMIIKKLLEPEFSNLIIQQNISVFTPIDKIDNKQYTSELNVNVNNPKILIYKETDSKKYYKTTYIGNKDVIIMDDLPNYNWTVTRETKTILGYETKKAIGEINNNKVVAWYTTAIPNKTGPFNYWGLPGLILEIEIESKFNEDVMAKKITRITEITTVSDKKNLVLPKSSKYYTQEEYISEINKLKNKIKEMENNGVDTGN